MLSKQCGTKREKRRPWVSMANTCSMQARDVHLGRADATGKTVIWTSCPSIPDY